MKNITIKDETHKKLKKIAERDQLSMSAFLDNAVSYFNQTKINPKTDVLSVKEEIEKLRKRVNEVIGFFRKNEQEYLLPLIAEVKKTNKLTIEKEEQLPTKEDFADLHKSIKSINRELHQLTELLVSQAATTNDRIQKNYSVTSQIKEDMRDNFIELLQVMLNKEHRKEIASKYNIDIKNSLF